MAISTSTNRPRRQLLAAVSLIISALVFAGCASKPAPKHADQVVVRKSERTLQLLHDNQVMREYRIGLGNSPRGHKFEEGDERTPIGNYILDWRNPNSSFRKSIHISYPNEQDLVIARALGVSPGGMIMIHGQPNYITSKRILKEYEGRDWTDGCIAVTNEEIEEIWRMVKNGTPIRILP